MALGNKRGLRNSNKMKMVLILGVLLSFICGIAGSLAVFFAKNEVSQVLDINPIVISEPTLQKYSADLHNDMIGKKVLANNIRFQTSGDLVGEVYVRCAILVASEDVDLRASTQYQDSFAPKDDGIYSWKQYKDYYYLFKNDAPAKLSSTDSSKVFTFLDEESLTVPSYLPANYFNDGKCSVEYVFEAINASLLAGNAQTCGEVESISDTPATPQTHTVKFFDAQGNVVKTLSNVAHGSSIASQVPATNLLNLPDGQTFAGWNTQKQLKGATFTDAKLANIVTDVNLYPTYNALRFTITVNQSSNGTISPETTTVYWGENINFFITPTEGYKISDVLIDGVSVGAVSTYLFDQVESDHTITATFEKRAYRVYATWVGKGNISPTFQEVIHGQNSQAVVITPDEGCYISSFKVNGEEQGGAGVNGTITKTFTNVSEDMLIDVVFENSTFTITVHQISNCSITPTVTNIPRGENVTITATPASGYRLVQLVVDGVVVPANVVHGQPMTYLFSNVISDHEFTAVVEENKYNITASVDNPSTGTVSPALSRVDNGGSLTLNLTPTTGYAVDKIVDNGKTISTTPEQTQYTINNVLEDHIIVIYYKITQRSISATIGANGTIGQSSVGSTKVVGPATRSLLVKADYGTNITSVITPNSGYKIDSIVVENQTTGETTIVDVNVAAGSAQNVAFSQTSEFPLIYDYLISVNFAQHIFNINVIEISEKVNGAYETSTTGGTVLGDGDYAFGAPISLTVQPSSGFEFAGYYSDAACTKTYEIPATMPNKALVAYAKFDRVEYLLQIEEIYETSQIGIYALGSLGGTADEDKTLTYGATISLSTPEAYYGFTFDGYYSDASGKTPTTVPTTMPAQSVILYARFSRGTSTLTINPNGGTYPGTTTVTQKYGSVYELSVPTREGHDFVGWQFNNLAPEMTADYWTYTNYRDRTSTEFLTGTVGGVDNTPFIRVNGYQQDTSIDTAFGVWGKSAFSVVAGKTYTLEFWVRADKLASQFWFASAATVYGSYVEWTTASGSTNTLFPTANSSYYVYGTGEWKNLSYTFTAPSGATGAIIHLGADTPNIYGVGSTLDIGRMSFYEGQKVDQSAKIEGNLFTFGLSNATICAVWKKKIYNLTIDPRGGCYAGRYYNIVISQEYGTTYTLFSQSSDQNATQYINSPSIAYTFGGWQVTEGNSANLSNNVFTFNSNATVSATWNGRTFNIVVNEYYENLSGSFVKGTDGGDVTGDGDLLPNSAIVLQANAADGFTFDNYYTSADFKTIASIPSTIVEEELVYYAKFTRNSYVLNFVVDCESVQADNSIAHANATVSRSGGKATATTSGGAVRYNSPSVNSSGQTTIKYGATIGFSATKNSGFEYAIYPNDSYISAITTVPTTMPSANTTYYVRYTRNYYKLTINPNGGYYNNTQNNTVVEQKYGTTYTVLMPEWRPAAEKYFTTWSKTGSNGSYNEPVYTFGVGNDTWTANYEFYNYTLNINPNGGNYKGSASVASVAGIHYNGTHTLTASDFAFTGNTLVGFTASGNATVAKSGSNWVVTMKGDGNVVAQWETATYNIFVTEQYETLNGTYQAGTTGGVVEGDGTGVKHGTGMTLTASPTTGFRFIGYYNGSSLISSSATYNFTALQDLTIIAKFERMTYSLTINPNGGIYEGSTSIVVVSGKFGKEFSLSTPTLAGHKFTKWNLTSGVGILDSSQTKFTLGAGDAVITAQYDIEEYDIIVNTYYEQTVGKYLQGTSGGNVAGAASDVAYNTTVSISAVPTVGYKFDGFYTTYSSTTSGWNLSSSTSPYSFKVTKDVTLYARFSLIKYSITLDATTNLSGTLNSTAEVLSGSLLVDHVRYNPVYEAGIIGYDFVGWNTKADGSGKYVGNMLAEGFEEGYVDVATGDFSFVSRTGYSQGYFSKFAVRADTTYTLSNYGSVASVFWISSDVGGRKLAVTAGTYEKEFKNDGYCCLFYNSTSSWVYADVCSVSVNPGETYTSVFGSSSNATLYAQYRRSQYYVDVEIYTTTVDNTTSLSLTGGVTTLKKQGESGYSAAEDPSFSYIATYEDDLYINVAAKPGHFVWKYSLTGSTESVNNEYSISDGMNETFTISCIDIYRTVKFVVYYSVPLVLDQNGATTGTPPEIKFYSNYSEFSLTDKAQSELPAIGTREFYYYSTGPNSSALAQDGTRYDLGPKYSFSTSSLVGPVILYATMLTPTSGSGVNGAVIPYGTNSISGYTQTGTDKKGLITYDVTYYYNGLGFQYRKYYNKLGDGLYGGSYKNTTVKYITLPRGFTTFGSNALKSMSSINGISFPTHTFTTLDSYCLDGVTSLNSRFALPETLTYVGSSFLNGVNNITRLKFGGNNLTPSNVSSSAFEGMGSLAFIDGYGTYWEDDNGILYSKENGSFSKLVRVPIKHNITEISISLPIASRALYNCDRITKVTILSSSFIAGGSAFYDCDSLSQVVITNVNTINLGNSCFAECSALSSFGKDAKIGAITLGSNAFYHCSSMTNVYLRSSSLSIGADAFDSSNNLTLIRIEGLVEAHSLSGVGDAWFYSAKGGVYGTEPVDYLTADGYYSCDSPNFFDWVLVPVSSSYTINYTKQSSDATTFNSVEAVNSSGSTLSSVYCIVVGYNGTDTQVGLPDVLYKGGTIYFIDRVYSLFTNTTLSSGNSGYASLSGATTTSVIKSLAISDGIDVVGNSSQAISNKTLEGITLPRGVFLAPGSLKGTGLTSFTFPEDMDLTYKYDGATTETTTSNVLEECESLTSVTFDDSTTIIPQGMFKGCVNLASLNNFHAKIKEIRGEAFRYCANIYTQNNNGREFEFKAAPTTVGENAFYGTGSDLWVIIPAENLYSTFKAVLDGKGFSNKTGMNYKVDSTVVYEVYSANDSTSTSRLPYAVYRNGEWTRVFKVITGFVSATTTVVDTGNSDSFFSPSTLHVFSTSVAEAWVEASFDSPDDVYAIGYTNTQNRRIATRYYLYENTNFQYSIVKDTKYKLVDVYRENLADGARYDTYSGSFGEGTKSGDQWIVSRPSFIVNSNYKIYYDIADQWQFIQVKTYQWYAGV